MVTLVGLFDSVRGFLEKPAARDYRAMLSAGLLIRLVGAVRGFVVAGVLGPADYGLLTAVRMVSMLDKYGSLGLPTSPTCG